MSQSIVWTIAGLLLLASPAGAEDVWGTVTAVKGETVTVRLPRPTEVSAGDLVELGFTTPDGDAVPVGTWRVVESGAGDSFEARRVEVFGEPQVGLDALVHATGPSLEDRWREGKALADAEGSARDDGRAFAIFARGCAAGHLPSCVSEGMFLVDGRGTARDVPRGLELLQRSCDGGLALGCSNLGVLYWRGSVVPKDLRRARSLIEKSCEAGEKFGCANLGGMYLEGAGGWKNVRRARQLLRRSCDDGVAWSCEKLEGLPH